MNKQSRWLNTFFAWVNKEVDASVYDAYQRAGTVVFDLMLQAELQRQRFQDQGLTPWTTPLNHQIQYLCLWNAFTLQTLGDQLLSTDYRLNPSTAGYVPPLTARQIETFYQPIEVWLSSAYQAQQNPQFDIPDLGIATPVTLPQWLTLKEMLNGKSYSKELERYLEGLLNAAVFLSLHIKSALALFEPEATNHKLHQLHADAVTTQDYVMQLWGEARSEGLYDKIENGIRYVIEAYFLLGQLLSMPSLIEKLDDRQWPFRHKLAHTARQTTPTHPPSLTSTPPENQPRIAPATTELDIWCLTSSVARSLKENNAAAIICLKQMWENDLTPQQTLRVQQQIAHALAQGYIVDTSVEEQSYFAQCPWSAIYLTKRPLIIAGDPLRVNQRFTYVCNVDGAFDTTVKTFGNRILRL